MTTEYIYNNYLTNISSKYSALLDDVSANYNFDYGTEYELVLCQLLQHILPSKYGVCRGFLISEDGEKVGDDIIIFDRFRFPQIRLLKDNDLAHKQEIPIEAAYAYIEAKNSLINGQDSDGKDRSFRKALKQVSDVKKLVSKREPTDIGNAFNPYISISVGKLRGRPNWPKKLNPFFTAIMAPQVRGTKNNIIEDRDSIHEEFKGDYSDEYTPDLIVAGKACWLPFVSDEVNKQDTYYSPFTIEKKSILRPCNEEEHAFAVGMCSLMYALDTICLGVMPWQSFIRDSMKE